MFIHKKLSRKNSIVVVLCVFVVLGYFLSKQINIIVFLELHIYITYKNNMLEDTFVFVSRCLFCFSLFVCFRERKKELKRILLQNDKYVTNE